MAYKYFSQELISSDLDLSMVFPDKQEIAKDSNNVTYNLGDIVLYLRDVTENFKNKDNKYIDLDNGIKEIITKYYKSIGTKNPFDTGFEEDVFGEFEEGVTPRDAATVQDGKIKGKKTPPEAPKLPEQPDEMILIQQYNEAIELFEMLGKDASEQDKEAIEILNQLVIEEIIGLIAKYELIPSTPDSDKKTIKNKIGELKVLLEEAKKRLEMPQDKNP